MPRNNHETSEPQMAQNQERRRHPRTSIQDLPITLDGDTPLRVRDLSQSGACFFSETPLRMMTHVRFTFDFPLADGTQAHAEGEGVVVRCERISPALGHYEVALFFQDLYPGSDRAIRNYLETVV
ncbi:MAG: PilZ domain-containing protein [Planctomycetota bacterium]|nr:PilZ domain-containing protein [Planctomycetota bacterium]MDA1112934.1 PilZ domain-containing protein [Planctomycetota bacterium]